MDLALRHVERDPLERAGAAEGLGEVEDRQRGRLALGLGLFGRERRRLRHALYCIIQSFLKSSL